MNKRIKTLFVLTVLIMLMCVFSVTVGATGGDVMATDAAPVEPVATEAPTLEPMVPAPTDAPVVDVEPQTQAPTVEETYYEEETVPVEDNYVEQTQETTNSYVDSYTNEDGYYYYDEEQMVNSIEDTAGNVSDYTDLYDTSDINKSELEKSEWDNITIDTSKTSAEAVDFSAIKDNKSTEDDGEWIIYTGIILIALSLLGILYFVIATATYKKKLKKLKQRELRQRRHEEHRARNDYGDSEDFPTQSDYNKRYQRNRYAPPSSPSYSQRKSHRMDTAEIELPRRYTARH